MPSTVQQAPAELRLCDENNQQSIVLTQYDSFTYTEVWGGADSFSITMNRNANHADELLVGRIIMVPADQTHDYYRVLIIRQIKVDEENVTASGRDYLWDLFDARLCLYGTDTGSGYDTQTGIAETVARHYINNNCIQASNTARRDPFTVLEAERVSPATPLGGEVTIVARLQPLSDVLVSICTQGGLNIYGALVEDNSLPRGWYIEARFSVGTDHSQDDNNPNTWVVLSEEYGNAQLTSYVDNVPTGTVIDVWGGGWLVERGHLEVGDTTLVGVDRRELFIDASDCMMAYEMRPRGEEELKKNARVQSVGLKLVNFDMYNRDFTIGDTVTCDLGIYGAYNLPVSEVETEYTAEGTSMSVVLGAEITGVMTVIRNAIQAIPLRRQ